MIPEFVECWDKRKHLLEQNFREEHPSSYENIFKKLVEIVLTPDFYNEKYTFDEDYFLELNSEKITVINDGDYQGTLLFIVPEKTYQPSNYWSAMVYYGSCSYCDTLSSIQSDTVYDSETGEESKPTEEQISQYMTLALHLLQSMKQL